LLPLAGQIGRDALGLDGWQHLRKDFAYWRVDMVGEQRAACGVWVWAAENLKHVEQARREFDKKGETD
jgi:hypothetical protein